MAKNTETAPAATPSLADLRTQLLEAKRSHKAGELPNPRVLTKLRKDIARSLTAEKASQKNMESTNA